MRRTTPTFIPQLFLSGTTDPDPFKLKPEPLTGSGFPTFCKALHLYIPAHLRYAVAAFPRLRKIRNRGPNHCELQRPDKI